MRESRDSPISAPRLALLRSDRSWVMRFLARCTAISRIVQRRIPCPILPHRAGASSRSFRSPPPRDSQTGFGCSIPEAKLARLPGNEDRIRCIFEKSKQFRFKHLYTLSERLYKSLRYHRGEISIDLKGHATSCPAQARTPVSGTFASTPRAAHENGKPQCYIVYFLGSTLYMAALCD
jgi:hypothetical protein